MNDSQRRAIPGTGDTDAVTLDALLRRFWYKRWWLTAFGVAGLAMGVGIGFLTTPVYRVEVLLAPVQSDRGMGALGALGAVASQFGDLTSLAGLGPANGSGNRAVHLAQMTSRRFTETFLATHNLLPVLYAKRWDKLHAQWRTEEGIRPPTSDEAFTYFDRRIRKIRDDRKTGLITLSIEWRDRRQAADWANQMVADINEEIRQREISQSQQALEYLNRELAKGPPVGLREAIFRLMETHVRSIMMANVRRDFAFQVVDPAVVPDEDRYVRPKWLFLIAGGLLVGVFLGMLLVARRTRPGAPLAAEQSEAR